MLKKNSFQWTEEARDTFYQLKKIMSLLSVLALLDFSKPFVIESDASGKGVGAMLMQEGRPIAYMSQAFEGKTITLSKYQKEFLALVLAVQR